MVSLSFWPPRDSGGWACGATPERRREGASDFGYLPAKVTILGSLHAVASVSKLRLTSSTLRCYCTRLIPIITAVEVPDVLSRMW